MNRPSRILRAAMAALLLAAAPLTASAQFVVHSRSGQVKIERNGAELPIADGTQFQRGDVVNLADGATLKLRNTVTGGIYQADGPARMSVAEVVAKAMKRSSQHAKNVAENISTTKRTEQTVYEQTGNVRRTQAVLDPEASWLAIDAEALAIAVMSSRLNPSVAPDAPVECRPSTSADTLGFTIANRGNSPMYFNVLKLVSDPASGALTHADISELGQPVNAYVIQPQQEFSREDPSTNQPGTTHLLVATHFGYDIDELLDIMQELIEAGAPLPEADPELQTYIFRLSAK